jgi:hypothetical protein
MEEEKREKLLDWAGIACGLFMVLCLILSFVINTAGSHGGSKRRNVPSGAQYLTGTGEGRNGPIGVELVADENGIYYFVLSEQGLNYTVSVEANVYMLAANMQDYISLGLTSDVLADWDTGLGGDDFDGYWFSLPDGQNLSVNLVDERDGYDLYTSPVKVNDDYTNLRFAWYHDSGEVKLLDLWDGVGDNGIAARSGESLKTGDRIVPQYDAFDVDSYEESTYSGVEYVWTDGDRLGFGPLSDGSYLYSFYINDIFGGSFVTDNVRFDIDQGSIRFNAA